MSSLSEWLAPYGETSWLLDVLLLPAAVLVIFGLRALYLAIVCRQLASDEARALHGQTSKTLAFLASLTAVALIWRFRLEPLVAAAPEARARGTFTDWLGGIINAVILTAALVVLIVAVNRLLRYILKRISTSEEGRGGIRVQGTVLITARQIRQTGVFVLKVVRAIIIFVLFYFYVPLLLVLIPATRPLAGQVMPRVLDPIQQIGIGIVGYMPRFISLVLILLLVRYVIRLLGFVMNAIARGAIRVPGFDPEWAEQTGRLLRIVLVLGTTIILYPFLPGAGSEVFKGFSLFVGALFTLGASSSVSNMISGIILTFNRSFRLGDRIQIGGTVGDVVTRGLFMTRLRTIYNEEVMVPNNVALSGQVVNYSAALTTGGLALTVRVGIGYDVEWRKVHELMKGAAAATEHVIEEPEPVVLQQALGDFAVTYELMAWTDEPKLALRTQSELRQQVLDAFHEAGVEIMTPIMNAVRNAPEAAVPSEDAAASALRFLGVRNDAP